MASSTLTSLCYDEDGRNYEGIISTTKSFRQCMLWPQSSARLKLF